MMTDLTRLMFDDGATRKPVEAASARTDRTLLLSIVCRGVIWDVYHVTELPENGREVLGFWVESERWDNYEANGDVGGMSHSLRHFRGSQQPGWGRPTFISGNALADERDYLLEFERA